MPGHQLREAFVNLGQARFNVLPREHLDDAPVESAHLASGDAYDAEARVRHARVNPHDHDHG
jgi:hypothetical protein